MTNLKIKKETTKRSGKRRQVSKKECLFDLKEELPKFFKAFNIGVNKYNKVSAMFRPNAKVRFDATVLNTAIVESLQDEFPFNWKWGKYKRFILRLNDHIVLVKKFNKKNMPMNIKTEHVNTISNQLSLPLFKDEIYQDDPILFFGYKVDRMGEITSPQLVYIDENQVRWVVTEEDVTTTQTIFESDKRIKTAEVSIKKHLQRRKTSNE